MTKLDCLAEYITANIDDTKKYIDTYMSIQNDTEIAPVVVFRGMFSAEGV